MSHWPEASMFMSPIVYRTPGWWMELSYVHWSIAVSQGTCLSCAQGQQNPGQVIKFDLRLILISNYGRLNCSAGSDWLVSGFPVNRCKLEVHRTHIVINGMTRKRQSKWYAYVTSRLCNLKKIVKNVLCNRGAMWFHSEPRSTTMNDSVIGC